jgi:hypothetical protein
MYCFQSTISYCRRHLVSSLAFGQTRTWIVVDRHVTGLLHAVWCDSHTPGHRAQSDPFCDTQGHLQRRNKQTCGPSPTMQLQANDFQGEETQGVLRESDWRRKVHPGSCYLPCVVQWVYYFVAVNSAFRSETHRFARPFS